MNSVSRTGQMALVALAVFCSLMIDGFGILRDRLETTEYVTDFAVYWVAGQIDPASIYDMAAITRAQAAVIGQGDFGPRPFVNPPSMLPWLAPFGALPYWPALILWWGLGLLAYVSAARSLLTWRRAALIAAAPTFVLTLVAGQVSLFIGALVIMAVLSVEARPILAGALFGLAATIKPQTVVLAPFALAASGHWRALGATLATGFAIGLTCLAVQGPELWIDWLRALGDFGEITKRFYFTNRGVTPASLAAQANLGSAMSGVLIISFGLIGVAVAMITFRYSRDPMVRLAGLVSGGLLVSPYALPPETVVLLVPAASWLLGRDIRAWFAGFLTIAHLLLPAGVIVSAITAAILALRPAEQDTAQVVRPS